MAHTFSMTDGYLYFSRTYFTDYVEDNSYGNCLNNLWFKQDSAPTHNTRVPEYLSGIFPGRVISNNRNIIWPARSPDLSLLDYYLWRTTRIAIYKSLPAAKMDHLNFRNQNMKNGRYNVNTEFRKWAVLGKRGVSLSSTSYRFPYFLVSQNLVPSNLSGYRRKYVSKVTCKTK